ncbi:MAG: sigma-70 family RNA polymerase sigma factor [Lachnospiraceae bacterium]|nr:sigma-70 family RNA polymerase sigma factor [Lachnospiraceae bacterium]
MQNHIFSQSYLRYYSRLLSFAHTHLSDYSLAEDFVQDFFLYIYEQFHDFPEEELLFHTFFQRLSPMNVNSLNFSFPENNAPSRNYPHSEDFIFFQFFHKQNIDHKNQSVLSKIFSSLTPLEKRILHLTVNKKKNAKEIGKLLSLSHSAVRKRLERLRKKIYALYEKQLSNL